VRLRYVATAADLGVPDLLILPGTKATLADLAWLRETGLGAAVLRLAAAGTPILGICGGYQMLGHRLADPDGVEGAPSEVGGLGLLDVATVFQADKATHHAAGRVLAHAGLFGAAAGLPIAGYEIHLGRTVGAAAPFARLGPAPAPATVAPGAASPPAAGPGRPSAADGAVSPDGLVAGTYLHGLFGNDGVRRALLQALARRRGIHLPISAPPGPDSYDRLADTLAASVDLKRLFALAGLPLLEKV
jgi:adenosylcobyric acid synthase